MRCVTQSVPASMQLQAPACDDAAGVGARGEFVSANGDAGSVKAQALWTVGRKGCEEEKEILCSGATAAQALEGIRGIGIKGRVRSVCVTGRNDCGVNNIATNVKNDERALAGLPARHSTRVWRESERNRYFTAYMRDNAASHVTHVTHDVTNSAQHPMATNEAQGNDTVVGEARDALRPQHRNISNISLSDSNYSVSPHTSPRLLPMQHPDFTASTTSALPLSVSPFRLSTTKPMPSCDGGAQPGQSVPLTVAVVTPRGPSTRSLDGCGNGEATECGSSTSCCSLVKSRPRSHTLLQTEKDVAAVGAAFAASCGLKRVVSLPYLGEARRRPPGEGTPPFVFMEKSKQWASILPDELANLMTEEEVVEQRMAVATATRTLMEAAQRQGNRRRVDGGDKAAVVKRKDVAGKGSPRTRNFYVPEMVMVIASLWFLVALVLWGYVAAFVGRIRKLVLRLGGIGMVA